MYDDDAVEVYCPECGIARSDCSKPFVDHPHDARAYICTECEERLLFPDPDMLHADRLYDQWVDESLCASMGNRS